MKQYEGIILDWAGTTVDYGCFAPVKAFLEAFEEFGITPTEEEVRKPMGMLKIDHIRTMLSMERIRELWVKHQGNMWTEEDVKAVYQISERKLLEHLQDYAEPKPGVLKTVNIFREMGLKIGSTTGYTDEMMEIVVKKAALNGYAPDYWCSPDSVNGFGRPYPYMIFRNMEELHLSDVHKVIKAGDTAADIREGRRAGVVSVGIIEGSSAMGLSLEEYESLSAEEKKEAVLRTRKIYEEAGADYIVQTFEDLLELVQ